MSFVLNGENTRGVHAVHVPQIMQKMVIRNRGRVQAWQCELHRPCRLPSGGQRLPYCQRLSTWLKEKGGVSTRANASQSLEARAGKCCAETLGKGLTKEED